MTTATLENPQLIPGYTTTERLGSGGYGEVWRAEAPGGFQKAIKVVYGFHDDERAKRELKALEHIKCVRHPFLLSVERAEIVDGRLAILMELADESLDQRFEDCREQGLPGIPREELLGYVHDAADALDFLLTRHALQHLDIKPENMLLVAGHIKVADFGLVKDVTERSQFSMVGGMTPTYAAPELFDGRPSRHSDQYSLAIVYQEMLTGALPFPGKTSAQLALQHTQGRPMLTSLPHADREVVARALSKKPTDRFGSCLEFVETLRGERKAGRSRSSVEDDAESLQAGEAVVEETESLTSGATECLSDGGGGRASDGTRKKPSSQRIVRTEALGAEQPVSCSRPVTEPREEEEPPLRVSSRVVEASLPDVPAAAGFRPTLYIGIGGLGARVLAKLREELSRHGRVDWSRAFPFLVLDTDRLELQTAESGALGGGLSRDETVHLPLRRPQHYRSESTALLQWLSRRWLYNIPRTLQTRGFRPLGRLALVDHAQQVQDLLRERLASLTDRDGLEAFAGEVGIPCRSYTPRAVLVGSTNGGTGGGMGVDLAYAVRSLVQTLRDAQGGNASCENIDIMGLFTHATRRREEENALSVANTYSWLSELATIDRCGYGGSRPAEERAACFEGDGFPFDTLYFVHLGDDLSDVACDDALTDLIDYLACDAVTPLGAILEACRRSPEERAKPQEDVPLRTFALSRRDRAAADQPSDEFADVEVAPETDPEESPILPHGCGHTRRRVAVAPDGAQDAAVTEFVGRAAAGATAAVTDAHKSPVLDVVAANVRRPFVLHEAEGLSLAHVAAKLVENRPDAAEAAHRLHIRNDIEWRKLPDVVVEE